MASNRKTSANQEANCATADGGANKTLWHQIPATVKVSMNEAWDILKENPSKYTSVLKAWATADPPVVTITIGTGTRQLDKKHMEYIEYEFDLQKIAIKHVFMLLSKLPLIVKYNKVDKGWEMDGKLVKSKLHEIHLMNGDREIFEFGLTVDEDIIVYTKPYDRNSKSDFVKRTYNKLFKCFTEENSSQVAKIMLQVMEGKLDKWEELSTTSRRKTTGQEKKITQNKKRIQQDIMGFLVITFVAECAYPATEQSKQVYEDILTEVEACTARKLKSTLKAKATKRVAWFSGRTPGMDKLVMNMLTKIKNEENDRSFDEECFPFTAPGGVIEGMTKALTGEFPGAGDVKTVIEDLYGLELSF